MKNVTSGDTRALQKFDNTFIIRTHIIRSIERHKNFKRNCRLCVTAKRCIRNFDKRVRLLLALPSQTQGFRKQRNLLYKWFIMIHDTRLKVRRKSGEFELFRIHS